LGSLGGALGVGVVAGLETSGLGQGTFVALGFFPAVDAGFAFIGLFGNVEVTAVCIND
jgi:hypothetical protein